MESGDLDTSFTAPGVGRFRINGFRQKGDISFALRFVPAQVPTLSGLGLPPGVQKLADEQRGLILVTGATGSGKTTTLAAMIDHVN
jgi:twitching motility protein PilT